MLGKQVITERIIQIWMILHISIFSRGFISLYILFYIFFFVKCVCNALDDGFLLWQHAPLLLLHIITKYAKANYIFFWVIMMELVQFIKYVYGQIFLKVNLWAEIWSRNGTAPKNSLVRCSEMLNRGRYFTTFINSTKEKTRCAFYQEFSFWKLIF